MLYHCSDGTWAMDLNNATQTMVLDNDVVLVTQAMDLSNDVALVTLTMDLNHKVTLVTQAMDLSNHLSLVTQAISTVLGVTAQAIKCATTFVELGGDSLSAILIAAECQKHGIAIAAGVFFRAHTLDEAITKAVLSAKTLPLPSISPAPNTFPERSEDTLCTGTTTDLETTNASHGRGISAKRLLDRVDAAKFTESQLLLLRGSLHNPKLNTVTLYETYTEWDIETVRKAWTSTILNEPIFADLIQELNILPQQLLLWRAIQADTDDGFEREVLKAVNASDAISRITAIQSQADETHITVVWRIHHAFIDGYSARILLDKVGYSLRGEAMTPGPPFRETMDLLRTFQDERRESTRSFWASKREQYPAAISELRFGPQSVPKDTEIPQGCITIQFPDEELAAATGRTGFTRAVYFAAAWALTLSKFMDADQVSFGLVFSGRDLPIPGAFGTVGPLINILPLFVSAKDHEASGDTFLRRIHEGILELNDVQHSEAADGFDRHFDSVMATQFECDRDTAQAATPMDRNRPDMQSGVPLNIIIEQKSCVQMLYSAARYAEDDVENIRSVFLHSMNSLLQDNTRLYDTLPCEMEKKIRQWSNCNSLETLDDSKGDDLVTLFENAVARRPDNVAIIQSGLKMSYDAFDQGAAAVARALGWIRPNEVVCVFADRSVNWLIAIFGILKAGGVYAPLDPSAPVAVRQANFIRSGARVLLVPACASRYQNDTASFQCLVVEDLLTDAHMRGSTEYPRRRIARPDDLAYICFTSGSTGRPKAVQCTHKGLVAFQKDHDVRLAAAPGVVVAQVMSPVFDGSIHEIFSALTYGATLRLASLDQEEPLSHLQESDSAILTPSIAKALCPDQYPRLRSVYLVGEAVPQSVCDIWAPGRLLYNMYGPTEATCGATIRQLLPHQAVTLGRPNPSSRVYILDRSHRLLPPGAVGELYLAGIQVSHGYINLQAENLDRFLNDSIMPQGNQKMYKTGDYGYWDSVTGELCLVGRKDRQIKLRGFRLDLDDLEARVAKAIPDCQGAAIFRRDDHLIAAYLAPSVSATSAKALIRQVLPPYAMPRGVISLDKFPLTAAGKLDYKALETMSVDVENGLPEPQGSMIGTEKMLVDAVRRLLKLNADMVIDQNSDFTMLGGHSILQLQLAHAVSSFFRRRFTVRTIIENPVISALASVIDTEMGDKSKMDQPRLDDGITTLGESGVSPIELDWFRKYRQNLGTSSFNVSCVSKLDATFNQHQALVTAWNTVLARHSILRCRFRNSTHGADRAYATKAPRSLYLESFDIKEAINKEFLLETEDPIRVLISESHMLVCVSHIICDYTTLNRLFEEFTAEYFNEGISTPQKRYQDTHWNIKVPQATADFWKSYLSDMNLLRMPYMKQHRTSYSGESLHFRLSNGTMSNLRTVSRLRGLTLHQIALGIVSLVLQADNPSKQDLLLGSPYLGRQEADMRTVGLFLQPLPIRIPRSDEQVPISTFLKAVQKSAQSALSHGIGWSSLMDSLAASDNESLRIAAATAIPNHPLFNAMVTFHELGHGQATKIAGIDPLVSWAEGSKFAIMFEFSAISSSSVTLRIEYDSSLFSSEEIRLFASRINAGLESICQDPSVEELEQSLLQVDHCEIGEVEFGTPLAALSRPSPP